MNFTVLEASHKGDKPDKGYGPMQVIALSLKDENGAVTASEWYTKASTPVPAAGTVLMGELKPGSYGLQFKKQSLQGGGPRGRSPEETAAIQRQHSQSAAVEFLKAKIAAGALENGFPTMDEFRQAIDWFERDIANHAVPYAKEKRRDLERTGQSDLPEPAPGDFEHPKVEDPTFA